MMNNNQQDNNQIKVNIDGELEDLNTNGVQSDGSQYFHVKSTKDPNHEHNFELKHPGDRIVSCICGKGGHFYPHSADLIDGHIYTKDGVKVI